MIGQLVAAIDGLPHTPWSGRAFRHVAPQFQPLSGEGARINGGRWNPPNSVATLYLGLSRDTVIAEFHRMATKYGLATTAFLPRVLYGYDVVIGDALDLRGSAARAALGLDDHALSADPPDLCQRIGEPRSPAAARRSSHRAPPGSVMPSLSTSAGSGSAPRPRTRSSSAGTSRRRSRRDHGAVAIDMAKDRPPIRTCA